MGPENAPIRAELDGRTATWSPEAGFAGDPGLVGRAKFAAVVGLEVPLGDTIAVASDSTATGAAAALASSDPDRVRILQGPDAATP